MNFDTALSWAAQRKHATLITIRSDGRPQSSDIVYRLHGSKFAISLTADRAKTANMRRDARVVLHISEPVSWSYLSLDGTVELSEVTASPDDATSDLLVDYYRSVAGADHDDWAAYRQAMIDEHRLLATFTPTAAVGQINGP